MKKNENMPEVMKNSDVLIEHSASITGFDATNYCRLKYTGKFQNYGKNFLKFSSKKFERNHLLCPKF